MNSYFCCIDNFCHTDLSFLVILSDSEVSIKSKYGFFAIAQNDIFSVIPSASEVSINLKCVLNSVDFSPFCKRLKMTSGVDFFAVATLYNPPSRYAQNDTAF